MKISYVLLNLFQGVYANAKTWVKNIRTLVAFSVGMLAPKAPTFYDYQGNWCSRWPSTIVAHTCVVKASDCVGSLHMLGGVVKLWVFNEMVLLSVESIQVKEILGHLCLLTGVGVWLKAQTGQQDILNGVGQTRLQRAGQVSMSLTGNLLVTWWGLR